MKVNYEKLEFYNKSLIAAKKIYIISKKLPEEEKFALANQIQRAAVSVPSNIAEGSAKSKKDFARFLGISLGSLYEIKTQLRLIAMIYGDFENACENLAKEYDEIGKMIFSYKKLMSESDV